MTRARDIANVISDANLSGTLDATGIVTANAGVKVDNITIDGTEIDLSSGNLTLDVAGQLIVNSDSGQVVLQDDTVNWGNLQNSSGDFIIGSLGADKDLKIQGLDSSSTIDALTFDMSDAGTATFNHDILTGLNANIDIRDADGHISGRLRNVSGSTNSLAIEADPDSGASNSFINFKVDGSECARIDSSANIFAGRTSLLTDFGAGRTSLVLQGTGSQDYATIQMGNNGTASNTQILGILAFYDGTENNARVQSVRATSTDSADLLFSTRPASGSITERMRIHSNGYTDISNNMSTSTRNGSTSHVLHQSAGDITTFIENSHNANPYGLYIHFSGATKDDLSHYFLACQDSTATRLIIFSNGNVQNANNQYNAFSDEKLKEQIKDASSQWEDIKALKIRKYKMKEHVAKGDSDEHWQLGVIAQELETSEMNGLVAESPDRDPNTNEDLGTTTKSVKYSILYMKAVKALQEAMARIETLEADVKALKGE